MIRRKYASCSRLSPQAGLKKTWIILKEKQSGLVLLGFIRDFLDFTWNNIVGFEFYFKREEF